MANKLINESSPYLLQHANNPVDWYAWNEEAWNKARNENKLVLVSIGYSSCHWCHVMEHESFEDETVARIMNDHFVCIKVDREERPDVDQIYMNAVQLMNGQGGWPLNCFTLPDQRPIYGGTYFRKTDWINILLSLASFYKDKPEEAKEYAVKLTEGIRSSEMFSLIKEKKEYSKNDLKEIYEPWKKNFDYGEGGHNWAPKFPLPNNLIFLLRYGHLMKDESANAFVHLTLHKMAYGGIYDQLGGGFARYSVDAEWKVPHFEKMLYDNAQLLSIYSEAYQQNNNPLYKKIVYGTVDFIQGELMSDEGGAYSALDADSEGEEGKFYCWTKEELENILGNDAELFCIYYNVTDEGNWEEKNILLRKHDDHQLAEMLNTTETELLIQIERSKKKLLEERNKRVRPGLDDKILASWNGLLLKGLCDSYKILHSSDFRSSTSEAGSQMSELIIRNAEFMEKNFVMENGKVMRNYKNGKVTINGFLDDYAFIADAYIELYQITFDEKWLMLAKKIKDYAMEHFYDKESGMFFYTSDEDEQLIARKMEIHDNVIPSSNSAMARVLYNLGLLFENESDLQIAVQMLNNVKDNIKKYGSAYSNWGILMMNYIFPLYEVAIIGKEAKERMKELNEYFIPNKIVLGTTSQSDLPLLKEKANMNDTLIYVCVNKTCQLPVVTITNTVKQIH